MQKNEKEKNEMKESKCDANKVSVAVKGKKKGKNKERAQRSATEM